MQNHIWPIAPSQQFYVLGYWQLRPMTKDLCSIMGMYVCHAQSKCGFVHKNWGYVWWWVWCWIVLGLVVIMLGGKYEDFLFNIWSWARCMMRLSEEGRKEGTCLLTGKFVYINWGRSVCFLYPSNLMMKVPMITTWGFCCWLVEAWINVPSNFSNPTGMFQNLCCPSLLSTISHSNQHRCAWSNKLQVSHELSYNLSS